MPEVPELEHVAHELDRRLGGRRIGAVEVDRPVVVRMPSADFIAQMTGARFEGTRRIGKFLLVSLDGDRVLVVAPMLTGRFQWTADTKRKPARTCFSFTMEDGEGIRYVDQRVLGKAYLVPRSELDTVPGVADMGPDVLDPALTEEVFLDRLRKYTGQVKNVITNAKFMAGVGNAYSDEILFVAGIHPFTKVKDLDEARRKRLYAALGEVMDWACPIAVEEMGERIDKKPREFLRVHRKGGEPCPQCSHPITDIGPDQRIISFCRNCQPS